MLSGTLTGNGAEIQVSVYDTWQYSSKGRKEKTGIHVFLLVHPY